MSNTQATDKYSTLSLALEYAGQLYFASSKHHVFSSKQERTSEIDVKLLKVLDRLPIQPVSLINDRLRCVGGDVFYWHNWQQYRDTVKNWMLKETVTGPFLFLGDENGYYREDALKTITHIPNSFCLSLVLYRFNDWVPQVRLEAVKAIKRASRHITNQMLIDCIEILYRSEDWGRGDEEQFRAITDLYNRDRLMVHLAHEIINTNTDWAVRTLKFVLRANSIDDYLIDIARKAKHPGVRRLSTQVLLKGKFGWIGVNPNRHQRREPQIRTTNYFRPKLMGRALSISFDKEKFVRDGLQDKHPPVRLLCLQEFAIKFHTSPDANNLFQRFLFDKSYSISDLCAFYLKLNKQDVGRLLRDGIKNTTPLTSSVIKLFGRYGDKSDVEYLLDSFKQSHKHHTQKRYEALQAAMTLDPEKIAPILEQIALGDALADAKIAVKLMAAERKTLSFDILKEKAETPIYFIARDFYKLTCIYPPWKALEVALTLTKYGSPEPRDIFQYIEKKAVNHWRPTPEDVRRLNDLVLKQPHYKKRFSHLLELGL